MDDLMYSSREDSDLFLHEVRGLPHLGGFSGTGRDASGAPIPFGVGPHSVRCIRRASEAVRPRAMLEIGFNLGYSSALWLHFTTGHVLAIDISDKAETLHAAEVLRDRYPDRFEFLVLDSRSAYAILAGRAFDFAFIDGDHTLSGVKADIDLVLRLGIKHICFDDYLPQFGQVQEAIALCPVVVTEVMGNIALGTAVTW